MKSVICRQEKATSDKKYSRCFYNDFLNWVHSKLFCVGLWCRKFCVAGSVAKMCCKILCRRLNEKNMSHGQMWRIICRTCCEKIVSPMDPVAKSDVSQIATHSATHATQKSLEWTGWRRLWIISTADDNTRKTDINESWSSEVTKKLTWKPPGRLTKMNGLS